MSMKLLLSCLILQFAHLNEHKFRHDSNDTVNPMFSCGAEVETTEHFHLRCHCFSAKELNSSIIFTILIHLFEINNINKDKVTYLWYGSTSNSNSLNKDITEGVTKFFKSTGRFNKPLLLENENEIILVSYVSLQCLFC